MAFFTSQYSPVCLESRRECSAGGSMNICGAIRRILRHLGLPADPIELAPARAPPELDDAWAC